MAEDKATRVLNSAIKSAINILNNPPGSCRVVRLSDPDCPFHIECIRYKETRKIRVVIDKITDEDRRLCREWNSDLNKNQYTIELWLKKTGGRGFAKVERI